jgi:hypothetical protein
LIKMVEVTFSLLAICLIIKTVTNPLKQKKEKKMIKPKNSLAINTSSQIENIVAIPKPIRMFCFFLENSSENMLERIMAVNMILKMIL